ncbi:hypothetical protein SRHO_G00234760 [Serrasalmus rhombeus]
MDGWLITNVCGPRATVDLLQPLTLRISTEGRVSELITAGSLDRPFPGSRGSTRAQLESAVWWESSERKSVVTKQASVWPWLPRRWKKGV